MTTLKDLTELVKKDDEQIIKNQERANTHLESLDKNFSKFFDQQERARLDQLEDRLESKRARTSATRAAGAAGASAAVAGGGLGFGSGVGLGALLTSPKMLAVAAAALFGRSALKLGKESFNGLRNALDDRAKTNRGLLRFEADELRRLEQAKKVQLEADKLAQTRLSREKNLEAKKLIRQADQDARLKQEARLAAAESDAARIKAAALRQEIAVSKQKIRALTNVRRLGSPSDIRTAIGTYGGVTADPSIDRGPGSRLTAPTAGAFNSGMVDTSSYSRPPTVSSNSPSKLIAPDTASGTAYERLKGFSDPQISAAGYRRVVNLTTGSFSYIPTEGGSFQRLTQVLADVQASQPTKKARVANTKANYALRGLNFMNPVEAAIQETAELAAKSKYSAIAKTGGTIARVMGSAMFNAAMFSILPSTAADGTISGFIQQTYNGMINSILSGDGKFKDPYSGKVLTTDQWRGKLKEQVSYHPSFFQDGEGASMKMIANLPTAEFVDFKSRVRIYSMPQMTPGQIATAERQQMAGYAAGFANVGGVTVKTTPDYLGNSRRQAAVEAFRAQEESLGGNGGQSVVAVSPNVVQNNNSQTNINPIVIEDTPTVADIFNGGLTAR